MRESDDGAEHDRDEDQRSDLIAVHDVVLFVRRLLGLQICRIDGACGWVPNSPCTKESLAPRYLSSGLTNYRS